MSATAEVAGAATSGQPVDPAAYAKVEAELRSALAQRLAQNRFGGVLQPGDAEAQRTRLTRLPPILVASTTLVSFWAVYATLFVVFEHTNLPGWTLVVAGGLVGGIFGMRYAQRTVGGGDAAPSERRIARALLAPAALPLAAAAIAGAVELALDGPDGLFTTHVVTAVAIGAASLLLVAGRIFASVRQLGVGRGMTLAIPIVVVALFVPLFSAELWTVADGLSWRDAIGLAAFILLPLVALLFWHLRNSVVGVFTRAAADMAAEAGVRPVSGELWRLLPAERQLHKDDRARELVTLAYRSETVERRAEAIAAALQSAFSIPLLVRLVPLVVCIAGGLAVYVYILAGLALDAGEVGAWIHPELENAPPVDTEELPLWLLGTVTLPGEPYLVVAILLGAVAAAIFVASALTEEEYRKALAETTIHRPIDTCLRLTIPYTYLCGKHDHRPWAIALEGPTGALADDNRYATADPDDAAHAGLGTGRTLWYRWTAPSAEPVAFAARSTEFDPVLAVYPCDGDTPMASGGPEVRFCPAEGETYEIVVDGRAAGDKGDAGRFDLAWRPAPAPEHAAFATARRIEGEEGTLRFSFAYAGRLDERPRVVADLEGDVVWFAWTPATSGPVLFSGTADGPPVAVEVYRGTELESLEPVTGGLGLGQVMVAFWADAGVELRIAVERRESGPEGGTLVGLIAWHPGPAVPDNDAFAAAATLEGERGTVTAETALASREPGEPEHAGKPGGRSVWYRWTPERTAWTVMSTEGTIFDTLLAVYTGERLDALTVVAANDDAVPQRVLQSRVGFRAEAGVTYHVAVDGFAGEGGPMTLRWEQAAGVSAPVSAFRAWRAARQR